MANLQASGEHRPVKAWGGLPFVLPLRFTTNGSGVATLGDDHTGLVSIVKASNTYTITVPAFARLGSVIVSHSEESTVNKDVTVSPTAGTIAIAFSGAINSAIVDVLLVCLSES